MSLFTVEHIHRWANGHSINGLHEVLIEISKDLKLVYKQNQSIIMKQSEMAADMNAITAQVAKIGTESTKTLEKVALLEEALNNQDNVSPELQTAFDNLKAQVTVVDDLIPDTPGTGEEGPISPTPGGDIGGGSNL